MLHVENSNVNFHFWPEDTECESFEDLEDLIEEVLKGARRIRKPRVFSPLKHEKVLNIKVLYEVQSPYQHILLAEWNGRIVLFLDNEWQFISGEDAERAFHTYEVAMPLKMLGKDKPRVLIVGGGDGLPVRTAYEAAPNAVVDVVELDPYMVRLSKTNPIMLKLNKGAMHKANVIIGDGIRYMLNPKHHDKYDLVVVDLPDPIRPEVRKLYGDKLIAGILNVVKPDGMVSIYSTTYDSDLQNHLLWKLDGFFRKIWKVGVNVYEMGKAGFIWACCKDAVKARRFYEYVTKGKRNRKR